jgi:hypothetical protein
MEAKLETKTEEYDNLRKYFEKIKREKWYLEKKAVEKYQSFYDKCICLELGEFDPFFGWLCRQYEDLPLVIQTSADLSCMYSTHALFHLMKEANDPL